VALPVRDRPVDSSQNPAKRFRVLVVDDRAMPRIAARAMISEAIDFECVGEAASGTEALRLVPALAPDVILLDVEMPGTDGAETATRMLALHPHLTIVAWTVSDSSDDLLRMINAGCHGYVLKDMGPDELQRALRAAIRRESPVPRRMLPEVLERAARLVRPASQVEAALTEREVQTLHLIARGTPSKRIAVEMGIARSSVDTHLRNIYRKLGVNNRGEAVSVALRLGVITLSDL